MEAEFNTFHLHKSKMLLSLGTLRKIIFLYFAIMSCILITSYLFQYIALELSPFTPGLRSGHEWFDKIKGSCDNVRVEAAILQNPPENTIAGHGYAATCYGLAGKLDKAREWINNLPSSQQYEAAMIIFNVAHPIADSGDDASSGPMMELVIEFQPNNYMALYHAGMSEYILGDYINSKKNLSKFHELYDTGDIFSQRGKAVLLALETGKMLPVETVKGFTLE